MNEFGQRSVASLLRASFASSGKQGGQVSLAEFLDRRSTASASKGYVHEDDKKPQLDSSASMSFHRVSDSLRTHRLSTKRKRSTCCGDTGTKVVLERQLRGSYRPHLLVMGDVPMRHTKSHKSGLYQSQSYNHYADGRGWWGEGMVGMEEAGTACEWEGVASMSLGASAATSP